MNHCVCRYIFLYSTILRALATFFCCLDQRPPCLDPFVAPPDVASRHPLATLAARDAACMDGNVLWMCAWYVLFIHCS